MGRRRLGNSELWVAPLGFGGNVFGWTVEVARATDAVDSLHQGSAA